jgi:succinoglycan biosynthesis protein ExoA
MLIVIPTLNEAAHIEALLIGLVRDLAGPIEARIVVVDGGSTDGTCALVERVAASHPNVQLLHNRKRTQSTGINLAVREFGDTAEILVRCDAHSVYPEGFCARLLDSLERTGADSVVVPLDSIGESPLQRAIAWVSNSPIGTGGAKHRAGHASGFVDHGHHAAFRMEVFRKTGGYDEDFVCNEDAELDCRQRALGARIYLDASIRVAYYPRATLRALYLQYFRYGLGRSRTVRRHPESVRMRQLAVPAHVIASALSLSLSFWSAWLLAWPALYASVLLTCSLAIAVRERSWAGLLAGPAAATMHTAWGIGFLRGLLHKREARWAMPQVPGLQAVAASGRVLGSPRDGRLG